MTIKMTTRGDGSFGKVCILTVSLPASALRRGAAALQNVTSEGYAPDLLDLPITFLTMVNLQLS